MRCPECGFKIYREDTCPKCNADLLIWKKCYTISAKLYNKGLEQAKERDLSGAISSLKDSIAFDKTNMAARNLLGLVYYETGRIADALVQWVVSSNLQKEKNVAIEYMDKYEKDARGSEKLEDTLHLYNEALEYVNQKNDDLAIIRLKKALDINPQFIDALNLLAMCYLMRGRNNDALDIVKSVLRMDVNNSIALGFFRHLCPDKSRPDPRRYKNELRTATYTNSPNFAYAPKRENVGLICAIGFGVGVICAALVMGVLIIPGMLERKQGEIDEVTNSYETLKKDFDELTTKSNELAETLATENEELKGKIDSIDQQDLITRKQSVDTASELYNNGSVEEAANMLLGIDTSGFEPDLVNRYTSLKSEILPAAAERFYNSGRISFRNGNFEEAKTSFNQAITCSQDSPEIKYSALYQLGKIAYGEEDVVSAKEYFTQVAENHPTQSIKRDAENYLKMIEQ